MRRRFFGFSYGWSWIGQPDAWRFLARVVTEVIQAQNLRAAEIDVTLLLDALLLDVLRVWG